MPVQEFGTTYLILEFVSLVSKISSGQKIYNKHTSKSYLILFGTGSHKRPPRRGYRQSDPIACHRDNETGPDQHCQPIRLRHPAARWSGPVNFPIQLGHLFEHALSPSQESAPTYSIILHVVEALREILIIQHNYRVARFGIFQDGIGHIGAVTINCPP